MGAGRKDTSGGARLRTLLRRAVRRADRALAGPRVVLTREQSRELDRLCLEEFAIPSILLMEHASLGVADVVRAAVAAADARVLVLAGGGNNGGDGLAVARHLLNTGLDRVAVVLAAEPGRLAGDAAANLEMAVRLGVRVVPAGPRPGTTLGREGRRLGRPLVVVDALLGTGLTRPAGGAALELLRACNQLRERDEAVAVLAVDVPSGLDADTGEPPAGGEAIVADATATMAGLKPGLSGAGGRQWAGIVGVTAIGAPATLLLRLGRRVGANPAAARRERKSGKG